ncbi:DUF3427 domain-containing protein [uncultured Methanosphaera sp.]|uniref:DUF3427 domain-containing protein n=1 Tax=uncultured Methanosphaera sp. TaxID=262501 RepID=UPI0025E0F7AB|nr:DEAD/DEAH box helicase [uncultured Methanosphaera sp.]
MSNSKFIINNSKYNVKVISTLQAELENCEEFYISVAFITESGITPLLQTLKELEENNIPGKILTTDYLFFSEPKALRKLNQLKNIDVRLYSVNEKRYGFHTKGYIFKNKENYDILIGSSNITQKALTVNKEWNILTKDSINNEVNKEIIQTFNEYWDDSIDIDECITQYEEVYEENIELQMKSWIKPAPKQFKPNNMQKRFMENLSKLVDSGKKRGLLISATGTGKTYASAFGLKKLNPNRVLFLVHREQIAKQAKQSYEHVFNNKTMGMLSGNNKNYDSDFIFSTIQMMSREENYTKYNKNHFDYIVIDEVHRAGAKSYQKIMNYFETKFYIGMTASPDRSDDFDIYSLFDHNIIYEIRLKDVLEEDMLCTFNYFGITDKAVDVNDLSSTRVDNIIENIEYYGYSGNRVKGLVFCNTNKNSKLLSDEFNRRGYKTISLSGDNSQKERDEAIDRLTSDTREDYLDYIFTVDIFNEGVDIKEVNQIVMLRETESSIIFIQQLGRGLRKSPGKEYVVVLDFIGNYNNNFMIPIALSGDTTYDKDTIRKFMINRNNMLVGCSTINFDKISSERIYKSINKAKFNNLNFIRNEYFKLKNKLGHIPTLYEFYKYNQLNPMFIINCMNKLNSLKESKTYPYFVAKVDNDYNNSMNTLELLYLEFITQKLANGRRPHELVIIEELIKNNTLEIYVLENILKERYNIINDRISIESAIRVLDKSFYKPREHDYYLKSKIIDVKDDEITIDQTFKRLLDNKEFKDNVCDLLKLGLTEYEDNYNEHLDNMNFKLYERYSRADIAKLLNWPEKDAIYGYVIKNNIDKEKTCPFCVTYDKKENNEESTKYVNKFYDNETLSWMATSSRTFESKDIKEILNYKKTNMKFYLFMKKNNEEGKTFYYMGPIIPTQPAQAKVMDKNGELKDTVNFKLKLKYPVREDMYEYFIN